MPAGSPKDQVILTASPEGQPSSTEPALPEAISPEEKAAMQGMSLFRIRKPQNTKIETLHPYVQTLSLVDLESCVALEQATFPEHERCSREKARPYLRFFT